MKALNIPVGISNFEKIRNNGFYYVDKTGLSQELLKNRSRSDVDHPTTSIWKNTRNEYARKLF